MVLRLSSRNGLVQTASLPDSRDPIEWNSYHWLQPLKIKLPGVVKTLEYDALQRPVLIKSQVLGLGSHDTPKGDVIMDYRYQYDDAGNITQRETEKGMWSYNYDLVDRLIQASPPENLQKSSTSFEFGKLPNEVYSYDAVHNRLSSQHQPGLWKYNEDNQLLEYGMGSEKHTYTYNSNGHTATENIGGSTTEIREFVYNSAERLAEIKDNGVIIASYQYDPMGRRIKKQTPTQTTWFIYTDEGLIAELTETGVTTRIYGWKPGGSWGTDPLWLADKTSAGWGVYLYHNDHLWTPQYLTDINGRLAWSGLSEAFGKVTVVVNAVNNPLRFPGQYLDYESSLSYNDMRFYNPLTGSYLEMDPLGIVPSLNMFSYTQGRPILGFDNEGLCTTTITGAEFSRDWCVTNVELLWEGRRRREDMKLIVDVKGDMYFDFVFRCSEKGDECLCPEINRSWTIYLYYSVDGVVVPWLVPESYLPSPNKTLALIRMALTGRKLWIFKEKADALINLFPIDPDAVCKTYSKQQGPIKLGGSC